MLIEQINHVGLQPFERGVHGLLDMRRLAVQTGLLAAIAIETELGGDDHLPAHRRERLVAQIFNLLYRRISFGRPAPGSRLADYKSAIQPKAILRYFCRSGQHPR